MKVRFRTFGANNSWQTWVYAMKHVYSWSTCIGKFTDITLLGEIYLPWRTSGRYFHAASPEPTLPTPPPPIPPAGPFSQICSGGIEDSWVTYGPRGSWKGDMMRKDAKESRWNGESGRQKSPSKWNIFIRYDYMSMPVCAVCNPKCKLSNDVSFMCISLLVVEIQAQTWKRRKVPNNQVLTAILSATDCTPIL